MAIVISAGPLLEQQGRLRRCIEKDRDGNGADTHHASWTVGKDLAAVHEAWEHHFVPDKKEPAIMAVVLAPVRVPSLDAMTVKSPRVKLGWVVVRYETRVCTSALNLV